MKTKTNDRGEKLVRVKNVDTGVVVWRREEAYKRSMKQWELTTEPLTDYEPPKAKKTTTTKEEK